MIKYCTRCVMPDTRPGLMLDEEGVCSACRAFEQRGGVDWAKRKAELLVMLDKYRSKDGSNYDCIIPVSGGKDSHYQVIRMLELGMNPLCVTATTCSLTAPGRRNIENLKGLGVDYIEVTTNPIARRRLNKIGLLEAGDISWPEHATIFTIPVRVAAQMNVPLIVWGENPQNEYGGPAADAENPVLTREWCAKFGDVGKVNIERLLDCRVVERKDLIQYTYPSDEELKRVGVTGIFLGHYLPWDGYNNLLIAQGYGFETHPGPIDGGLVNYENLDNKQTGIHDYFKFLKFGFGRATDHACMHIRRGRLSREDGLELVKKLDGKFPHSYLGYSLTGILAEIDMGLKEFLEICDKFTNRKLFKIKNGLICCDRHGNLTKTNYDNISE